MKKSKLTDYQRCLFSIFLKSLVIAFVIAGVTLTYFHGYSGGEHTFLYFTCQSNLWIGIFDLICLVVLAFNMYKKQYFLSKPYYYLGQVLTVSIALTGIVYTFILAPGAYLAPSDLIANFNPFNVGSIFVHMVVPTLAVIDYFLITRNIKFKGVDGLWSLIPVGGYFIFAIIGYCLNLDFGRGNNFPYFFLNFASPAGIFGFSSEMPYFMGSFYWIILGFCIVFGLSYCFIGISNKINKRQ